MHFGLEAFYKRAGEHGGHGHDRPHGFAQVRCMSPLRAKPWPAMALVGREAGLCVITAAAPAGIGACGWMCRKRARAGWEIRMSAEFDSMM